MRVPAFLRRRKTAAAAWDMGSAQGAVLAAGGAEDKVNRREILERVVREAGGRRARIAVLPTASEIPEERAAFYVAAFRALGAANAHHVPITVRADAHVAANVGAIRASTGVFLTGGDQSRLVDVLGGSPALGAIVERLRRGGVVAGTSAGASAFSATMIIGGQTGLQIHKDAVKLAPGLGIIGRLIIDQHFSQRDRLGRLLTAVALQPGCLGVGIDEDTAIVYSGAGQLEVVGTGQVFILDGSRAAANDVNQTPPSRPFTLSGVQLHVLPEGGRFDVQARAIVANGHTTRPS
jgi:cyanophycinase